MASDVRVVPVSDLELFLRIINRKRKILFDSHAARTPRGGMALAETTPIYVMREHAEMLSACHRLRKHIRNRLETVSHYPRKDR